MPYQFTSSGLNPNQNSSGQWLQLFMSLLQPSQSPGAPSSSQNAALAAGQGPLNAAAADAWQGGSGASSQLLGGSGGGFNISKYGVSTAPPQQSSY